MKFKPPVIKKTQEQIMQEIQRIDDESMKENVEPRANPGIRGPLDLKMAEDLPRKGGNGDLPLDCIPENS